MKKILLLNLFLFLSILSFAQKNAFLTSTTEEEYNYLTKGYKVQIESGLDPKKGYSLQTIGTPKSGNYEFEFKTLIRDNKKEVAAILVITKSKISGKTYYSCIPINNDILYQKYYDDLAYWDKSLITAYSYYTSLYFSMLTSKVNDLEKAKK